MGAHVRVVDGRGRRGAPRLSPADTRRAARRTERIVSRNPLRRARLGCCGWLRDPVAKPGDHVWCEHCRDWVRVLEVAE